MYIFHINISQIYMFNIHKNCKTFLKQYCTIFYKNQLKIVIYHIKIIRYVIIYENIFKISCR